MKFQSTVVAIACVVVGLTALADGATIKHRDESKNKNNNIKNKDKDKKDDRNHNPYMLSAAEERFSSCGNPNSDFFKVDSISSNRHLCSGCKACIDIGGSLKGRIEKGAQVRLKITKFFLPVYEKTFDLCSILEDTEGDVRCPIEASNNHLHACIPLDTSIPTNIAASSTLSAVTANYEPLFCITGNAMIESNCPSDACDQ
ncbi:hypothetical protein BCR41DRAFT_393785 [Lobosporangium transversale]|uniref:Phosphatidylglycerol/phosphatidylinositol transfer protein n=1 Tax=Lobosporangium transversale TaxID=64571 RepID=A0A1Y2GW98_9FUNG|nr:hypothetical protein BCR41DRAFT_393785 [Lobosporangium transversale]ORZ24815.1 hypothetical protein BCR41DRAFT_393785 [Lobosporangium transversale]|eukprot:XP_021883796.1 hypothetical protein BCR41DRAFT_393785 [Lobosporangium transversale]